MMQQQQQEELPMPEARRLYSMSRPPELRFIECVGALSVQACAARLRVGEQENRVCSLFLVGAGDALQST